jgi:hypothetical protein
MHRRPLETIVAPPPALSRDAWECGHAIAGEHSSTLGSPPLWLLCQEIAGRVPESLNWEEIAMMRRAFRALHGGAHG